MKCFLLVGEGRDDAIRLIQDNLLYSKEVDRSGLSLTRTAKPPVRPQLVHRAPFYLQYKAQSQT